MSSATYYITDRSITSGNGKTYRKHKVVTAEVMGLTTKQFESLLLPNKKTGIASITKGTPPLTSKEIAAREKEARVKAARVQALKDKEPAAVLRPDRIFAGIKAMFDKDGNQISEDDFTNDGKPSCDALDVKVLIGEETNITADERDIAWDRYEKEKNAPQGD